MITSFKKILQFLLHSCCLICNEKNHPHSLHLCPTCIETIKKHTPHCIGCGLDWHGAGQWCFACQNKPPILFEAILSTYNYQVAKHIIYQMKYAAKRPLAHLLAQQLAKRLQTFYANNCPVECIIPLPAANKNVWRRRFDQSIEIAHTLSKLLNIPCKTLLKNITPIHTINYAHQKKQARLQLTKRFVLKKTTAQFEHIALVDDVITTTHSIRQAIQLIKNAGITKKISVWTVARTNLN